MPPGRLRNFELIIFQEVSQLDEDVSTQIQVALGELSTGPSLVFAGDFQQLQPIGGRPLLHKRLMSLVRRNQSRKVVLQQHAAARCTHGAVLDFLNHIRFHRPQRNLLQEFFRRWIMHKDCGTSTLTDTNAGATKFNTARVNSQFRDQLVESSCQRADVPVDPQSLREAAYCLPRDEGVAHQELGQRPALRERHFGDDRSDVEQVYFRSCDF